VELTVKEEHKQNCSNATLGCCCWYWWWKGD